MWHKLLTEDIKALPGVLNLTGHLNVPQSSFKLSCSILCKLQTCIQSIKSVENFVRMTAIQHFDTLCFSYVIFYCDVIWKFSTFCYWAFVFVYSFHLTFWFMSTASLWYTTITIITKMVKHSLKARIFFLSSLWLFIYHYLSE